MVRENLFVIQRVYYVKFNIRNVTIKINSNFEDEDTKALLLESQDHSDQVNKLTEQILISEHQR